MLEAFRVEAGRTRTFLPHDWRKRKRIHTWQSLETLEERTLLATDPILVVSGNGHKIAFHDASPSLVDTTDFGVLTNGDTSVDETFIISNGGAGTLSLADSNPVTFTGANAADFSVGSLTNNTDGTATLVVHFAPAAGGVRNATLHIASNDPKHSDFSFAVRGDVAFTDFNVAVGNVKVPVAPATSDGKTTFTVPVTVTNTGGLAVSGTNSFADIQVFLHNTATGDETLVTTLAHQSLKGISTGSKTFNVKTTLPLGLSAGTYTFVATVNAAQTIPETNPITTTPLINNSAASVASVNVLQGVADLHGNLVSETFVPAVLNDTGFKGKLTFSISNEGNVALPSTQKVSVEIRAHNGTNDVVLQTISNISVAKLKAGATKNVTVSVNDVDGLPTGTYTLQAFITPTPGILTDNTGNNLISQTASGQSFSLISGPAFVNLTGVLGKSSLKTRPADAALHGTLQVTVTNSGNEKLSSTQKIRLELFADEIPLGTGPLLSVGSLAPGASKTFTAVINVPAGLSAGSYILQAQIDTSPDANETSLVDNLISENSLGNNVSLTIV
ncbi:MAG TPA: choice-of-anchor D domain-containing protein [Phycisphaerae bacterium]|nr:choice-of-anchor D domain-containing protein [Phycisphaerae bacterium]